MCVRVGKRYGTGSGNDRVPSNGFLPKHPVATAPGTVPKVYCFLAHAIAIRHGH